MTCGTTALLSASKELKAIEETFHELNRDGVQQADLEQKMDEMLRKMDEHLKRFRKRFNGVMTIESNPNYLDAVLELLGFEGAKDVPTPSVPAHKEKLTTGELLNPAETTMYRQCVGGLLYNTQDRADAQYEVSILGSMLRKPTQGSMIALKRVTRYLKGTRDFVNKLELDTDVDKRVTRPDGFSDSGWGGSTDQKSQSSGVLFVDGAPLYSFSRRQSVIATSSGMAEFYAGCATAEEMLLERGVLMFFGCQVEASLHMDSAAARGISGYACASPKVVED